MSNVTTWTWNHWGLDQLCPKLSPRHLYIVQKNGTYDEGQSQVCATHHIYVSSHSLLTQLVKNLAKSDKAREAPTPWPLYARAIVGPWRRIRPSHGSLRSYGRRITPSHGLVRPKWMKCFLTTNNT